MVVFSLGVKAIHWNFPILTKHKPPIKSKGTFVGGLPKQAVRETSLYDETPLEGT